MLQDQGLRITPDNINHKNLEKIATDYLISRNYATTSVTYHDVMPLDIQRRLSRLFTFTSLYIRGRADRLAIHNNKPIVFEWDVKTNINSRYEDLTIEIYPLIHHIIKSWVNVRCLYICSINGKEGGFWVDELPVIREIRIPENNNWKQLVPQLTNITNWIFPNTKLINPSPSRGSGDPFAIIDKTEVSKFTDWRLLIP